MENASKALIITGAVLIAILVLTMGVYLIGTLGQTTDSYVTALDTTEVQKYNKDFDVFINRKDVTAQEIVTLISIAKQKGLGTKIYIDNVDCTNYTEEQKTEFLSDKILTYTPEGKIINSFSYDSTNYPIQYGEDGRVTQIGFKANGEIDI